MLIVCYAAKGGSGTSVVAAALALTAGPRATLVDLGGDAPGVLGLTPGQSPGTPGIAEWLHADVGADALADLGNTVGTLTVIGRGHAPLGDDPERWDLLVSWLAERGGTAVVDAGTGEPPEPLCRAADRLLLVARPCYLGLARAAGSTTRPTGVIVVREPGRALNWRDVEAALGVPVIACVLVEPAVARAVDAGLFAAALPRHVARNLHAVLALTPTRTVAA